MPNIDRDDENATRYEMTDTKPTIDEQDIVKCTTCGHETVFVDRDSYLAESHSCHEVLRKKREETERELTALREELKCIQSAEMPGEPETLRYIRDEVAEGYKAWLKPTVTYIDALKAYAQRKDAENERLLINFAHYHVQSHDGHDTCKECGLNLRDKIHFPRYIDMRHAAIDNAMAGREG